ncbi:ribosomal protein S18 acetylase RimI-like enzyme [Kribbella voronezhensis]|uniref:Ribosomal protein S18 acetylase RimI-like enzyme n=1 Tax=Kribbella voronezhensis TaxID=2512212 RepID=A0A4R7T6L0_9ACTN|nr:GNAT family N-acetyltransferase [Kribbella voronezhensis]TDU87530.1 ribosomal protein S18 acetylase RimI-like enzyme [Kribbella voronezhensis]
MTLQLRAPRSGDSVEPAGFAPQFVAEADGDVVGCAKNVWWDEADGTRLHLLLGWIAPRHRGRGHGRELLAWQEDRARLEAIGTSCFGVNVDHESVRRLAVAAGYGIAFTRIRMTVELDEPGTVELPAGVEVRPAGPADHRAVFNGNAAAFKGSSSGYRQDTFEEFAQDVADDFPDHRLWTLGWEGDRLVGWVVSGAADTPWVGVVADWRRRGLASALLRMNHAALWRHGVRRTGLWTVAENRTGSVALYERAGYRVTERQPRYRKGV